MTLHDAITEVLKSKNRPMSAQEIANDINTMNLYQRNDKEPVSASQIMVRIESYPELFSKDNNGNIFYVRNVVNDLLQTCWEFQKIIRNNEAHQKIDASISDFIVPLFFLFKRTIDYSKVTTDHEIASFISNNGLSDRFKQFVDVFSIGGHFSGEIIMKLDHIARLSFFGTLSDLLNKFNKLNLSVKNITDSEFGQFFSEMLSSTVRQKNRDDLFSTPKSVASIFYEICKNDLNSETKLYNPALGYSTIPALFAQKTGKKFQFFGEEINSQIHFLSVLNLTANLIPTKEVYCKDTFLTDYPDYSFDLAICNPPFAGRKEKTLGSTFTDVTISFLNHILAKLKNKGKAVILVPEGFLFQKSRSHTEFRQYLIRNEMIECVISLPAGIFQPYSGVKTSILVLSKKHNDRTLFIDGEHHDFYYKSESGQYILDAEKIGMEYHKAFDGLTGAHEPQGHYGTPGKSTIINFAIEKSEEDDLSVRKYLFVKEPDDSGVELKEVLSHYKGMANNSKDEIKFVGITNLNDIFYDFYLKEDDLRERQPNQRGRYVDTAVLMIGSIPQSIKPTFFKSGKVPVIVSENIHLFKVDKTKVDVEYLIFELNSKIMKDKILSISRGATGLTRFSASVFLSLKIELPTLEKQKEIAKIKKEAIYQDKATEAAEYAKRSGLTEKREEQILGCVKHEINNLVPGVINYLKSIQQYLQENEIALNKKFSDSPFSLTAEEAFKLSLNNLAEVNNLMENIQKIFDLGDKTLNQHFIGFKELLKSVLGNHKEMLVKNCVEVHIGINEVYEDAKDLNIYLDIEQFSIVIRNFLFNSIRHGYDNAEVPKKIVFNLSEDKDTYYISMINDGQPFPPDFTIDDFAKFGVRKNKNRGNGLGGYLMNRVVLNHNGTLELMPSGTALFMGSPPYKSRAIDEKFMKVGVHFLIKLPKA